MANACPPLPSCPSTAPVRCVDGRCVKSATVCSTTSLPSCPLGTYLCPTGTCQRECPAVSGCSVNEAMCANGECVPLLDSDLTGLTNYTDRCFSSTRAGSKLTLFGLSVAGISGSIETLDEIISLTISPFFDHEFTMIVKERKTRLRVDVPSGLLLS